MFFLPDLDLTLPPDQKKNPYVKFRDMATQSLVKNNPIFINYLDYFLVTLERSGFA